MLLLAWQNLRRQPGRFANAAAAVVASVLLVVSFDGLYLGIQEAMVTFLGTLRGDLVVAEAAASGNVLQSSGRIGRAAVAAVRAIEGIERVDELYGRPAWLTHGDREALVYLVGMSTRSDFMVPAAIVAGRARPALDQVLVDRVLASDLGVGVGDTVKLGAATLHVGGITAGGNSVVGSYAFVARGALTLAGIQQPSYLFVTVARDADRSAVAARIADVPGLQVFSRDAFARKNQALTRQVFLPLLAILDVVVALVGGINVAVALHTSTLERRAEYALLGALGVPDAQVNGLVLVQAAVATTASIVIGVVGAQVLRMVVPIVQPRFVIAIPHWLVAVAAATTMVIGLVAALRAVRTVTRIDPALVFRV